MSKVPSVVVLTGAGVSAESGLPTFRGAGGIWEDHRVEEVASPQAFDSDPQLVHRFYNERRQHLLSPQVVPNAAHTALADFERDHDGEFLLVTQNIDHLHEQAGSVNLVHMHGELLKKRCAFCNHVSEAAEDLSTEDTCTDCARTGGLRPCGVVWRNAPAYGSYSSRAQPMRPVHLHWYIRQRLPGSGVCRHRKPTRRGQCGNKPRTFRGTVQLRRANIRAGRDYLAALSGPHFATSLLIQPRAATCMREGVG